MLEDLRLPKRTINPPGNPTLNKREKKKRKKERVKRKKELGRD